MPRYEFRCRSCGDTFEVDRPMSAANDPADCPGGHADTVKLLSTVALAGRAHRVPAGSTAPAPTARATGGCCGGACGCG
jgi:putative FmdB family regulatory protein